MAPSRRGNPIAQNSFTGATGQPLVGGDPPVPPFLPPVFSNTEITGRPITQPNVIVLTGVYEGPEVDMFPGLPDDPQSHFDELVAAFTNDDVTIFADPSDIAGLPLDYVRTIGRAGLTTLYAVASTFSTYYSGITKIIEPDSSVAYGDVAPGDVPTPGQSFVPPGVVRVASPTEPTPQFDLFFASLDIEVGLISPPSPDACPGRLLFNFDFQDATGSLTEYGWVNFEAGVETQLVGLFEANVSIPPGSSIAIGSQISVAAARSFFGLS